MSKTESSFASLSTTLISRIQQWSDNETELIKMTFVRRILSYIRIV